MIPVEVLDNVAVGDNLIEEGSLMPAIVAWPTVVEEALRQYGDLFANEPERRHFAEYLTGLLVAERKTVRGINREFAVTTDQSCLNRWLTEVAWDVQALNRRRLAELQRDPSTRYATSGVIAIDNVLVNHEGELIADVGWFWDHAEGRSILAHDYVIANYVCPSGKHYPLDFRRFVKRNQAAPGTFKDHNELVRELIDWVCDQGVPGDFTFDCYFTSAETLNHLAAKRRNYVADLKANRTVVFLGRERSAAEVAQQIAPTDRKVLQVGDERQYYFTRSVRVPKLDHPVRLVILWNQRGDAEPMKFLLTNRTYWEVTRIVRVYRKRWMGTECFHRDGKQQLGLGACQVRDGQGQTRHLYLVFLAYSLLMRWLRQSRAKDWALTTLTTIGEACRAVLRETLQRTITWAIERATTDHWSTPRVCQALQLG
jgi:hypothetical protein